MFRFFVIKIALMLFFFSISIINFAQQIFEESQSIPSIGANSCKTFYINGELYMAIANFNNGASNQVNSQIYKWQSSAFVPFQTIATTGAADFEYVEYVGKKYLILASYANNNDYKQKSKVYEWQNGKFEEVQSLNTVGAYRARAFVIDTQLYLAIAFQCTSPFCSLNSVIYKFDGTKFDSIQGIPTSGASGLCYFQSQGKHYLAIANTYSLSSLLLEWQSGKFVNVQNISSLGATSVEYFQMDGQDYLAIANGRSLSSFTTNSVIYKREISTFNFFQNIQTTGAFFWKAFIMNNRQYLAVANYKDEKSNFELNSEIFQWDGQKFISFQKIPTQGATSWQYAEVNGTKILMVSNYKNSSTHLVNSKVYTLSDPLNNQIGLERHKPQMYFDAESSRVRILNFKENEKYWIEIFNIQGTSILSTEMIGGSIPFGQMKKGIYFVKIYEGENNFYTHKIVLD